MKVEVRQLNIVNSILGRGLMSAKNQAHMGEEMFTSKSRDSEWIEGCVIRVARGVLGLIDWKRTKVDVKERLYKGLWSIFPVIAERADYTVGDISDLPDAVLETRFANSLLVAMHTKNIELTKKDPTGTLAIKHYVSPDRFCAVILPWQIGENLGEKIRQTNAPLHLVPMTKATVFGGSGARRKRELTVPDYERFILGLLGSSRDFLFIHGVRLPTVEDL